jgi:hypothetical protein
MLRRCWIWNGMLINRSRPATLKEVHLTLCIKNSLSECTYLSLCYMKQSIPRNWPTEQTTAFDSVILGRWYLTINKSFYVKDLEDSSWQFQVRHILQPTNRFELHAAWPCAAQKPLRSFFKHSPCGEWSCRGKKWGLILLRMLTSRTSPSQRTYPMHRKYCEIHSLCVWIETP